VSLYVEANILEVLVPDLQMEVTNCSELTVWYHIQQTALPTVTVMTIPQFTSHIILTLQSQN